LVHTRYTLDNVRKSKADCEQAVLLAHGQDRTKLLNFPMLVLPGAQERTEAQYRALLEAAGLEQVAVHASGLHQEFSQEREPASERQVDRSCCSAA
jgi:hypothetical protein